MNAFLNQISGQFSKSLILGTLAPVSVFIILFLVLVYPLVPASDWAPGLLASLDPQWRLIEIALVVVVLSLMLQGLNIPIIRFYEGYPWMNTPMGQGRIRQHRAAYDALHSRWAQLGTLVNAMSSQDDTIHRQATSAWKDMPSVQRELAYLNQDGLSSNQLIEAQWLQMASLVMGEYQSIELALRNEYPVDKSLILPTRLGNIIRTFEEYPAREYKIDAIILWPRMVDVIEPVYSAVIDDAKTQFDFLINSSALSIMLATILLVIGVIYPTRIASPFWLLIWLAEIFSLAWIAHRFYVLSIEQARNWGDLVKSAFDLYRLPLLKKLGFQQEPRNRDEESQIWLNLSQQMIYGRSTSGLPAYKSPPDAPPTVAYSEPGKATLQILRGVRSTIKNNVLTVTIAITNNQKTRATKVVVKDTLPENADYQWGSSQVNQGRVTVNGRDSLTFTIDKIRLSPNQVMIVTYDIIFRPKLN